MIRGTAVPHFDKVALASVSSVDISKSSDEQNADRRAMNGMYYHLECSAVNRM